MRLDPREPARFLRTGYDGRDFVAIFLKSYHTGRAMQRVLSIASALSPGFETWLRTLNVGPDRWNVYVSVNAIAPPKRSRTRDAIGTVRHVFLDVDADADAIMNRITRRLDLPFPSYIIRTSPNRRHVLWRVSEVAKEDVEDLQRQLARDLGADPAATPCSQTTRLPGFFYLKSPIVRTSHTTLVSQGLTYAAVTHSWTDESKSGQRRRPPSLLAPVCVRIARHRRRRRMARRHRSKDVRAA